jgi:phosphate-selective porin OprO/OprP
MWIALAHGGGTSAIDPARSPSAPAPTPVLVPLSDPGSGTTTPAVPPAGSPPPPPASTSAPAAAADAYVINVPQLTTTFTAGWRDGFYIQSEDENFVLRLTGQMQADFRGYLDNHDTTDITTFLMRRARLGIEATLLKAYEFRLLPDFASTNSSTAGQVQDAYINVHYVDWLQVEGGKFKQPFSYEQLIQDRFVPFMERSMIDQLVPQRDVGAMIHGRNLLGNRLDYGVSIFNGEINNNPTTDQNNNKDLAWRVAVRPFEGEDPIEYLRGLQIGMAGTVGKEAESLSSLVLRTPLQVPWFQFNSTARLDGMRVRYSPEVVYFYGPLGAAAQYFSDDMQIRPNSVGPGFRELIDLPTQGFYVMTTYLLTGEVRREYSAPVVPLRNFDPLHPIGSPGAIELVARVSKLHLNSKVFAPGPSNLSDPLKFSNGATETTVGVNWYLNAWVRLQFNWEHAWFEEPVLLGTNPGGRLKTQDTLATRFQVIF